jgi:predicted nucleic acid-binding Zn ribbon protein
MTCPCINQTERLKSGHMPTYVYEGLTSGTRFEVEQRITEAPLTHNPASGEAVKRIIFASAVVFKGSGFYKNDSRAPEPSSKSDSSKSDSSKIDSKTDPAKSESSAPKTESSPTPTAASATAKPASAD